MRVTPRATILFSLALLFLFSMISVGQVPRLITFQDAILENYTVKIDVENQIAHVQIEQTYFNPTENVLEEVYVFPVPQGATISSLTLCASDGTCAEGELMGATEARQIYQDIVRQTKDPALLEYLDDRSFQVRVFPINPNDRQTIRVSYQTVLERRSGLVELVHPITSQKLIEQMLIQATIRDTEAIGNIYSPSHTISQERVSDNELNISFEANDLKSDDDFKVYYAVSQDDIALDILSIQPTDEDGFFLMLVSWPQIEQAPLPKDIIFVLDTSGSMGGDKIDQAKESLRHAVGRLNDEDRVGIVIFSDTIREYKPELVTVGDLDRGELENFISRVNAAGGTNIHSALLRGADLFSSDTSDERPKIIVFLTDGLPSAGETEIDQIVGDFEGANIDLNARIFTFGVGYDVNTTLLDTLSAENGGFTTYVKPGENLEDEVANFYDRVGAPLIWNLTSEFEELEIFDVYPVNLPDLFSGDMLEIVGRYKTGGAGKITLDGQGTLMSEAFTKEIELADSWTQHDYLPKIWAARAVGYLLQQIRVNGSSEELIERIRELGDTYGIVTPYNSFFAMPDEDASGMIAPAPSSALRTFDASDDTGQSAVQASEALQSLTNISSSSDLEEVTAFGTKMLDGINYQYRDGQWSSPELREEPDLKVEFGSEAYFELAAQPEFREILKLGSAVRFSTSADSGNEMTIEIGNDGIQSIAQLPEGLQQAEGHNQVTDNPDSTAQVIDPSNPGQNVDPEEAAREFGQQDQSQQEETTEEESGGMPLWLIALLGVVLLVLVFLILKARKK
jgi:Ca-activated chloride channel family protein